MARRAPEEFRLSRDRVTEIKRVLRAIHDRLPTMDAAERCGYDCQERREGLDLQRQQLEQVLVEFGPREGGGG